MIIINYTVGQPCIKTDNIPQMTLLQHSKLIYSIPTRKLSMWWDYREFDNGFYCMCIALWVSCSRFIKVNGVWILGEDIYCSRPLVTHFDHMTNISSRSFTNLIIGSRHKHWAYEDGQRKENRKRNRKRQYCRINQDLITFLEGYKVTWWSF